MLNIPTSFPNPGSRARLIPGGEIVRITQHNRDGTMLVIGKRSMTVRPDQLADPSRDAEGTPPIATRRRRRRR